MTAIPDLKQLEELIAKADIAALKAADLVQPAYAKALATAEKLLADLTAAIESSNRKQLLCDVIEEAIAARAENASPAKLEMASLVLAQYVATEVAARASNSPTFISPAAQQRDGRFILGSFSRFSLGMPPAQREKALEALMLAATGRIDPGLIQFPDDWTQSVSPQAVEEMAQILDPDRCARLYEELSELTTRRLAVIRYIDALQQAKPSLFKVKPLQPVTVTVTSKRGGLSFGDIQLAGCTPFQETATTELDYAQYARLREIPEFQSYLASGDLEITSPALVEQI